MSDYLAAFAYENSEDCSSSGNKFTIHGYSGNTIRTYESNGVMSKSEHIVDGTAVGVLSRGSGSSSSIPGYNPLIFLGITAIAGIIVIYTMKKKLMN